MPGSTAILLTLVSYKLALLGIGLWAARRTRNATDFFLGGRKLGPWVAAISASASSSSAWTLLGVSGAAYAWGLGALWIFPACVGGFALNWYVLAPRLRRFSHERGAVTVTDVIATDAPPAVARTIRMVATAIILVSLMTYVAAQFQGAGKTFGDVFGWSPTASVLLGGAIVVAYTLAGGFWAVSVTDTLQGLVMAVAAVALPAVAVHEIGGVGALWRALEAVDVPGYAGLFRNFGPAAGVGFAAGLLGIGLGYPGQPHVVNRFMAVRDAAALRRARQIAMGWAVVIYVGMLVLGLCAKVLLPALPDKEVAFTQVTQHVFPPVVAGVMIAAVLSAIMSTADSQLLVAGSAITHDLRGGGPAGDPSQQATRSMLSRSRQVVLALSAVAMVAALVGPREIFSFVLFAWSAMGAAFGPVLLLVVSGRRVAPRARVWAMVVGFALSVGAYWWPVTKGGVGERVVPFVVSMAVALGIGRRRG